MTNQELTIFTLLKACRRADNPYKYYISGQPDYDVKPLNRCSLSTDPFAPTAGEAEF